jgi:hypothetical protein
MRPDVVRLELAGIRVCARCGRGSAELKSADGGARLVIRLDPVRARQLSADGSGGELRSLAQLVIDQLDESGVEPGEVVLDVVGGRLAGLVSLVRAGAADVVGCTAEEGVALAVTGKLCLYATDEALAHAGAGRDAHGGSQTIH